VRLLFHEIAIDVGTRIPLVGVADDVLDLSFGLTARKPFQVQGKTRPAAAAQFAVFELRIKLTRIAHEP